MKTNQNEFLSAVLDDEAGEFERRRLLSELCDDAELGQTLNRYSLVGEAMRSQQRTIVDSTSFLAGIQAQLEDEPVYNKVMVPAAATANVVVQGGNQGEQSNNSNRPAGTESAEQPWHRGQTGRYAMAAGIAVAALVGVLLLQNNASQPDAPATLADVNSIESAEPVVKPIAVADAEVTAAGQTKVPTAIVSMPAANNSNHRMTLANAGLDQRTADTLKQYVTLHMQYRSSNGIAPSIQAVSYAQ